MKLREQAPVIGNGPVSISAYPFETWTLRGTGVRQKTFQNSERFWQGDLITGFSTFSGMDVVASEMTVCAQRPPSLHNHCMSLWRAANVSKEPKPTAIEIPVSRTRSILTKSKNDPNLNFHQGLYAEVQISHCCLSWKAQKSSFGNIGSSGRRYGINSDTSPYGCHPVALSTSLSTIAMFRNLEAGFNTDTPCPLLPFKKS